jgi:hypothetical protein
VASLGSGGRAASVWPSNGDAKLNEINKIAERHKGLRELIGIENGYFIRRSTKSS